MGVLGTLGGILHDVLCNWTAEAEQRVQEPRAPIPGITLPRISGRSQELQ